MAKSPKKRVKKKCTQMDIKRKEVQSIVNHAYQAIKFLGSCHHRPRAMGIQKVYTHLRGQYHEIGMRALLETLYREKEWGVGLICVFRDKENSEQYDVVEATAVIEPSTAEEISVCISDVLLSMIQTIQEADTSLTNDRFCFWGYFFEPEISPNLAIKATGLSELMMNLGDIDEYPIFGDELPGIPSDADTIPSAIENNGIMPKIKKKEYFCVAEKPFLPSTAENTLTL